LNYLPFVVIFKIDLLTAVFWEDVHRNVCLCFAWLLVHVSVCPQLSGCWLFEFLYAAS
jgi:hypothetical protein